MAQIARKNNNEAAYFMRLIENEDAEIRRQVIKMLGDVRYQEAGEAITKALRDESIRVRKTAAEALARLKYEAAKMSWSSF